MKILITTSSFGEFDQAPIKRLKDFGANIVMNPYGKKLSFKESLKLYTSDIVGVVAGTEDISAKLLNQTKSLRVVSRCGVGLDNVDLDTARKRKINVYKTSVAVSEAVAELTLGLMLNILRKINLADREIRQGKWVKPMGRLLKGKTLGIVGLGSVGKKLVMLVEGFKCELLAHDLNHDKIFAKKHHVQYVPLEELLKRSDMISLHLPFNSQTKDLFNSKRLALVKKGAYLINTSRGGIIDEKVLCDLLKSKKIAGAALDVFEKEPYKGRLAKLDNIVLTSHIGSYAAEARVAMEMEAVDNLIKGLNQGMDVALTS